MERAFIIHPNINIIGSTMHYHPKVTSPLGSASLLLKNSRLSDRSTEGDRSFKVNRSFDFESTFIDSPAHRLSAIPFTHTRTSRSREDVPVPTNTSSEQIKKNFLTKVIIGRMLAVRTALKKMQSLPIKIFKKSGPFTLAKLIVTRTKPNIETSILRTLLFAQERKMAQQSKLQCFEASNIFVLPTAAKQDEGKKEKAILKLTQLVKIPVKRAIRLMKVYSEQQQALTSFFSKFIANYERNREYSWRKVRQLPQKGHNKKVRNQLATQQLKFACKIIDSKHRALMQLSLSTLFSHGQLVALKQESAVRQMILFSKLRKEQCLKLWLQITQTTKRQQQQEAQVAEDKKHALTRIVQRNYMKLFMEITRRVNNFQIAACRIACNSKINLQKSLWRLHANMQLKQRQQLSMKKKK